MSRKDLAARLLATFIGELGEQVETMNRELLALETTPGDRDRVHALFRVAHTLKGAARAAGVPLVERVCHALESLLADAREGKRALGAQDFELLFGAADALQDTAERLEAGADLTDSPLAAVLETLRDEPGATTTRRPGEGREREGGRPPAPRDGQVRVPTQRVDALLATGAELLVAGGRPRVRAGEVEELRARLARCATDWKRAGRRLRIALESAEAPASDRRVLADVGGELERLAADAARVSRAASTDAHTLGRTVQEVLDHARGLRMRPFADACEVLPRAVRDLSVTAGKQVELRIDGAEVQADRVVLDGLREALLQMVRNAVDHGIEAPDERVAAGKPRHGTVAVAAGVRGDRLRVTVTDDGRGFDVSAIRDALRRRGMPVPADERDLPRALFEAGLSTRGQVTAVSGRGVGLDVARSAVERIDGRIDVTWAAGRQTTFLLDCPLTLASLKALLVSVGSQVVALPLGYVERLRRVRTADVRQVEGRHVLPTAEGPVPLVALATLLPPLGEIPPGEGPLSVVVIRVGARRLAVVVDEMLEVRELSARPIRAGEPKPRAVRGAALLETGRIALVTDPLALVDSALESEAASGPAFRDRGPTAPAKRCVLVVDDSITTRTLESSIVEAAGYEVLTAVDGSDAWRLLQEHACDLVVADIEMPRMDGFALCEAIRGSRRLSALPIVLVTALERPEDRARGLEVGADAYLGKSSFDQQHLLDTIRQLLE